jgi:hypothetical protein
VLGVPNLSISGTYGEVITKNGRDVITFLSASPRVVFIAAVFTKSCEAAL